MPIERLHQIGAFHSLFETILRTPETPLREKRYTRAMQTKIAFIIPTPPNASQPMPLGFFFGS